MTITNIKLSNKCKVCKLLHTDPDLWEEIHNKVLRDSFPKKAVMNWLNSQVELRNLDRTEEDQLPLFSEQNFQAHFKKHGDTFVIQKVINQQKALSNGSRLSQGFGFNSAEKGFAKKYADNFANEKDDLNDYLKLSKMITSLENQLWKYDTYLKDKDEQNQNRRPNLTEIESYQQQVNALMDLKTKLSKLKNSSTVAGLAVQAAIETSIKKFIELMMEASEESLVVLMDENPESSVPMEAIKFLRLKISENMKSSIPDILEKIKFEYNIK